MFTNYRVLWTAAIAFAASSPLSMAANAPLGFFAVDDTTSMNSVFQLFESASRSPSWTAERTTFATDIEVVGKYIYLAEFDGSIQKYSRGGQHQRTFTDLSSRAGARTNFQHLSSDLAGSLYSAFSGSSGTSRTSFRMSESGSVLATYSHPDLVFPDGIDAAMTSDVYIANGSANGAGRRVYRFRQNGSFINSYPLPEPSHVASLEIDEFRSRMYICDSFAGSILAYNIATGVPVFTGTLPALPGISSICVEPLSGRLFADYGSQALEIALDGSGAHVVAQGVGNMRALDVYVLPEPASLTLAVPLILGLLRARSPNAVA